MPLPIASRLIRKFAIDTEDPSTVIYQQQLEHVTKQAVSDRAVRQMDATRNPSRQTEAVGQIVEQLQPAMPATREQRPAGPVVKSTIVPKTIPEPASTTEIDQLTKAIQTFSVNLLQQV